MANATKRGPLPKRWDGAEIVCYHEPRMADPRDCDECGSTSAATGEEGVSISLNGHYMTAQRGKVRAQAEEGEPLVYCGDLDDVGPFLSVDEANDLAWVLQRAARFVKEGK